MEDSISNPSNKEKTLDGKKIWQLTLRLAGAVGIAAVGSLLGVGVYDSYKNRNATPAPTGRR